MGSEQCEMDFTNEMPPKPKTVTMTFSAFNKRQEKIRQLTARAEAAEKRVGELEAIVDRLPKDATNQPIVYGDTKWWLVPGEAGDDRLVQVVCWETSPLPDDSHYRLDHGHTHRVSIKGRGANAMNGELFDTREAAEQA